MYLRTNNLSIKWLSKPVKNSIVATIISLSIIPQVLSAVELVEKTLAIVNNEPILLSDLHQLEQRLSKSGMVDDLLLFDSSPEAVKKDKTSQLQFLINERIIDSEVKRHNLAVTMDRVDMEIREIAKRNNMSKDDLIKTIQSQGINIADYQSFMKQRIERQSVVEQEVTSKIRLSDEDVLAFYTSDSKKTFNKINEYTLSHIYFSPEKGGAQGALARAQAVLTQIRSGKSFDALLSKTTEEANPSANGFLGTFKSGEFSPEMEKAVRDLNIGEVSDIVRSRTGFHIIKLVSKKMVADPDFEKNKEKFRGLLFEKVFKRQFKAWIDLKRDEASIKIN